MFYGFLVTNTFNKYLFSVYYTANTVLGPENSDLKSLYPRVAYVL